MMCGFRELVEAGCLMSYGPNLPDLYRRAAELADKILRGTRPSDIPVGAADQVRSRPQPDNCQGTRPRRPANAARHRRRGDRIILASYCCICSRPLLALLGPRKMSDLSLQ